MVSHDLRTPVSLVVAASELAQRPDLSEERRNEQLEILGRAGRRMERLVDDLVELTRMEAGRLELDRLRTPVRRLLDDAAGSAAPRAEDAGIEVRVRPPDEDFVVDADPMRVAQVLDNLLSNALKFTPAGGTVTLAAEAEDGHVRISVTDTGPGIPEEHRERIFGRLYQVDPSDRRGVGLGLSICQAIVGAHGGTIHVESEPGQGATFSIVLPSA